MISHHDDAHTRHISDQDLALVASLLKRLTGIHLNPNKRAMIAGRLSKRMREVGVPSISAYCARLSDDIDGAECDAFISALTTNMTRFSREVHHFDHLEASLMPTLAAKARQGQRVRFWSAGCSSGEEAYDLAFRVLNTCPEATELDVRILATDIDKRALADAKTGCYARSDLDQLPASTVEQYFECVDPSEGLATVGPEARRLVTFLHLNLNAEWPFKGNFDVIMCRNVAIYFDEVTQNRLWTRLAERVQCGGVLYIGHSEVLPETIVSRTSHEGAGTFRFLETGAVSRSSRPQNVHFGD